MPKTIAQMFLEKTALYPNLDVQMEKNKKGVFQSTTYKQLEVKVFQLAIALKTLNIKRQQIIGLISDNCGKWMLSDLAIQVLGAIDVPRGSEATDIELVQILSEVQSEIVFVQNAKFLEKILSLKEELSFIKTLIVMESDSYENIESDIDVLYLDKLLEKGESLLSSDSTARAEILDDVSKGIAEEIATIIFTSGTTGACKGVMLTHDNFIFEVERVSRFIQEKLKPGQRWLSVLPVWHSFERAVDYTILWNNNCICYSKPISRIMLKDFQTVDPEWFPSVPRVWQVIYQGVVRKISKQKGAKKLMANFFMDNSMKWKNGYNKVKGLLPHTKTSKPRFVEVLSGLPSMVIRYPLHKMGQKMVFDNVKTALGKNFICGISAGGSMPKGIDIFFNAIGITLLDGYGMTETSPLIAVRDFSHPILGAMKVCDDTQIRVVGEDGKEVEKGNKGVLFIKGRQIMKGYYNNPEATAKILSADGWLNTGDLIVESNEGAISVVGRAKDTIVLAGGENLEPVPIEGKLSEVSFIESAIVIGQDRKYVSALIVPNMLAIKEYFKSINDSVKMEINKDEIKSLIQNSINEKVCEKFGFKPHELIARITILEKPFEIGAELSAKQELKRFEIERKYLQLINLMYAR
jgi:long-chain acyl-CoA synthetase